MRPAADLTSGAPTARLYAQGAAARLEGPLLFLRRTLDVGLGDAVEVSGRDGVPRRGRVAAIDDALVTIEVLESTAGLNLPDAVVRFLGEPPTFGLAPTMLGRVFNGVGRIVDGGPPIAAVERRRIDGPPSTMRRSTSVIEYGFAGSSGMSRRISSGSPAGGCGVSRDKPAEGCGPSRETRSRMVARQVGSSGIL